MGCCESVMRLVLGGGSGGDGSAEVEMGGASKMSPTLSDTLRGKDIIVLQTTGRPATLSGSGLALGCAPVEQVRGVGHASDAGGCGESVLWWLGAVVSRWVVACRVRPGLPEVVENAMLSRSRDEMFLFPPLTPRTFVVNHPTYGAANERAVLGRNESCACLGSCVQGLSASAAAASLAQP